MSGYHVRTLLLGDAMDTCGWSATWHVHHSERAVPCRHKLFLSLHVRNKGTCGRQPTSAQMIMRNLSTNVATVRCLRPRLEELELPCSFLFESFFQKRGSRLFFSFWFSADMNPGISSFLFGFPRSRQNHVFWIGSCCFSDFNYFPSPILSLGPCTSW